MKFVKAIARREGKTGVEMLLPIQGNETIFGKLAARLVQLQAVVKRERIHNLIAVDFHPVTDIVRAANHFTFHLHETNIDVSASGAVNLLLMSKDGSRLHWPKMSQADIDAMKQPENALRCTWCAGDLVQADGAQECPVCHRAPKKTTFQDIDRWSMFKLPDGSSWQKITPDDALCMSNGREHLAGQSAPIPRNQEVSFN